MDTTSLPRTGRTTHLKIAIVALTCAIFVLLVGVNARTADIAITQVQDTGAVVKAGQPIKM